MRRYATAEKTMLTQEWVEAAPAQQREQKILLLDPPGPQVIPTKDRQEGLAAFA